MIFISLIRKHLLLFFNNNKWKSFLQICKQNPTNNIKKFFTKNQILLNFLCVFLNEFRNCFHIIRNNQFKSRSLRSKFHNLTIEMTCYQCQNIRISCVNSEIIFRSIRARRRWNQLLNNRIWWERSQFRTTNFISTINSFSGISIFKKLKGKIFFFDSFLLNF